MERDNKMTAAGSSVHKPGRAVSMADVAKLAGVSRQTVSRVVNGQACVVEETMKTSRLSASSVMPMAAAEKKCPA